MLLEEAHHDIDGQVFLARRESGDRPVAFPSALVLVTVSSKPDDARTPHLRLISRDLFHHLRNRKAVVASFLIRNLIQKFFDTRLGWFSFKFCHNESPYGWIFNS